MQDHMKKINSKLSLRAAVSPFYFFVALDMYILAHTFLI